MVFLETLFVGTINPYILSSTTIFPLQTMKSLELCLKDHKQSKVVKNTGLVALAQNSILIKK